MPRAPPSQPGKSDSPPTLKHKNEVLLPFPSWSQEGKVDTKGHSHLGRPVHPQSDSQRWSPFTRPHQALRPYHLLSILGGGMVLSAAGLTLWPSPNCTCGKTRLDLCHCYTLPGLPQPRLSSPHQHQLGLAWLVSGSYLSIYGAGVVFLTFSCCSLIQIGDYVDVRARFSNPEYTTTLFLISETCLAYKAWPRALLRGDSPPSSPIAQHPRSLLPFYTFKHLFLKESSEQEEGGQDAGRKES